MIHYGDITKIKGAEVPLVDVVTGGSPCQEQYLKKLQEFAIALTKRRFPEESEGE